MEKKTFEQFTEEMRNEAAKLGTVHIDEITRTDTKYTGLFIKVDSGVPTPVVNLTALYSEYCEGKSMDTCINTMLHILHQSPADSDAIEVVKDWKRAQTKLFLRPFGSITGGIYRQVADIYLVPYLQLTDDGSTLVRVTDGLLTNWGVTEDEVFDIAKENQETLRPIKIESLGSKLDMPDIIPVYIVSTPNGMFGASTVFYGDAEARIRGVLEEDFYILPSSVHEVIVMPKSMGNDVSDLVEMVSTINSTEVDERDRLTNSVYTFENGEFKQAG